MANLRNFLIGAAVVLGLTASTAASAGDVNRTRSWHTSVVLVHGAWADGSSWERVTAQLQRRGIKVLAVQLPRATLDGDADTVRRAVTAQEGAVLLVGHSYGGAVITQAGAMAKVAGLVYVDAFAPGDNESINDVVRPFPPAPWLSGLVADSGGYLRLDDTAFFGSFAPDLPRTEAQILATSQGPIFYHVLDDKVATPAWRSKPSWWIYGSADMIIPAQLQQAQAARIGARTVRIIDGAGHLALISRSHEVSGLIVDALRELEGR
jgi:pimeloyl-ACP methyl ester carboxylesterase